MLKFFGSERNFRGEKRAQHVLHKSPFVVGRSATADLVLTSSIVSRTHCKFSQPDGGNNWLLECLSDNGLQVDGHRLELGEKKVLLGESLISFAEDVHLLFLPQFQDVHSRSVEIIDVPQIDIGPFENRDQKPELALYADRLSKALTDLARERSTAVEERNILQMRLIEEEKKVCNAKLRNRTLDRELKTTLALRAEELSKAQAGAAEATIKQAKAAEKEQYLKKRLSEAEERVLDAEKRCENLSQELKTTLALHSEELSKAQAEVAETSIKQAEAAEEEQDTQKRLSEAEERVLDAEQRYETLDRELKTTLALHSEELSKAQAEIVEATVKQAEAAEEVQNLLKRLSKEESKVLDAEQRNKHLEVNFLEAHSTVLKNADTTDILTKRLALTATELHEANQRNNCFQLELAESQRLKTAAMLEADKCKAYLCAREEEIRNLGLEIFSVQAKSSKLSDDVAKYKRFWEESELKSCAYSLAKDELAKELAALKEKTTKSPKLTNKQLNDVKEKACLDQVREFEEFIETDLQCAICFELVIAATALNCGHTFCSKCVRDWQARSANCPTCRVQITTMQNCKMLDSFIARAAGKLSEEFRDRRREATGNRGADSQGQPNRKKTKRTTAAHGRRIDFDLPGPEPVPEAQFFVDLT